MWCEPMPHGMREVTDDEILTVAEKIKTYRAMQEGTGHGTESPPLYPCQMPSHSHINPHGGCPHAHCHCCSRR